MNKENYIYLSIKYLLSLIKRQKFHELLSIAFITLFISTSNALVPIFYKYVIDEILVKQAQLVDRFTIAVVLFVGLYSIIFIASQVCWPIRKFLFSNFMLKLEQTMLEDIFKSLKAIDIQQTQLQSNGVVINYIDRGQHALRKLFMDFIYYSAHHFIKLVTILLVLIKMANIKYIAILSIFTLIYLLFTIHLQNKFPIYLEKVKYFRDKLSALTIDYLNHKQIKPQNLYIELLNRRQSEEKKLNLFICANKALQHFSYSFAIALIFCICANDLIREKITVGDMVMINSFAINFFNPIRSLGYLLEDFNKDIFDINNICLLIARNSFKGDKYTKMHLKLTS
ncbi:ABC transporter transmembrane domain-containing protein [Candidatus Jidaibacter acanthamoebae]|nr:ABC transporter transmembrane domain-containing protein [Candidatus Jidaibacter acanthamoeba]